MSNANIIDLYEKAVYDFPSNPCCSCNLMFKKSGGTKVKFSDDLGKVWTNLKDFLLKEDHNAEKKILFVCHYCSDAMRKKVTMPRRCVLNV